MAVSLLIYKEDNRLVLGASGLVSVASDSDSISHSDTAKSCFVTVLLRTPYSTSVNHPKLTNTTLKLEIPKKVDEAKINKGLKLLDVSTPVRPSIREAAILAGVKPSILHDRWSAKHGPRIPSARQKSLLTY